MRPEAVVKGEVVLFFVFTFDLIDDGGVVFHFYTGDTT